MKNPAQVAQKWQRNLSGSADAIRQGVAAVTTAPSQLAIKQKDVMVQNFMEAINSGKWERNLQKVTLQDWQNAMTTTGVQNITSGAAKGLPKMDQFLTQFLPYVEQGVNKLKAMPRGNLDQNIQRAVAMIRHNAEFKRQ